MAAPAATADAASGERRGGGALGALWDRLARPYDAVPTVSAIGGLSPSAAAKLVGTTLATSPEAEALLAAFPEIVRSMATAMGTNAERCIGELRGPVLWSETLSARASSFGDPDLFVCATPARAYDIDENRVLVAALEALSAAARDATDRADRHERTQDPSLEAAMTNGHRAGRFARHPSLKGVRRAKPTPREIKRTRSGKKRHVYRPALRLLARANEPVSAQDVVAACDRRTLAQHSVLMQVVRALERTGAALPPLRAEHGQLYAGPVQYRHPNHATAGQPAGILVGELLIDVPEQATGADPHRAADELRARADNRPTALVSTAEEVDEAVQRAITLAKS